ncbi:MAG: DUF3606 domain-containing protein [Afipia sp.]|nr:DUF3606 domain-containing protein [Afipia sp.]OJW61861.1 MAG: hypothetical protein BGO65_01480 [Afipia sp. 64-13]
MITLVKVSDVLAATAAASGQPSPVIDATSDTATAYWAARFGISTVELASAIEQVGPSVAALRRYLNK